MLNIFQKSVVLIYEKEKPLLFNAKRISVITILLVSFIIGFGRIYCLYDDAFVIYNKYKSLNNEEIHRAFNHTEFVDNLKKKIGLDENILVVKQDPANLFLSYYLYPRKVFKYKNTGYKKSTNTFEEVPEEWISRYDIKWVIFEHNNEGVKRLKNKCFRTL